MREECERIKCTGQPTHFITIRVTTRMISMCTGFIPYDFELMDFVVTGYAHERGKTRMFSFCTGSKYPQVMAPKRQRTRKGKEKAGTSSATL